MSETITYLTFSVWLISVTIIVWIYIYSYCFKWKYFIPSDSMTLYVWMCEYVSVCLPCVYLSVCLPVSFTCSELIASYIWGHALCLWATLGFQKFLLFCYWMLLCLGRKGKKGRNRYLFLVVLLYLLWKLNSNGIRTHESCSIYAFTF